MANVEFKDFTVKVKGAIDKTAMAVLEECAGEMESAVKRNTAVDTGKTKNSWLHRVGKFDDQYVATIGSLYENTIWEEFGTGEYALEGNGRKGGWFYVDEEGNGHFTRGKRPRRPFHRAYTSMKHKIIKRIQDAIEGGLS